MSLRDVLRTSVRHVSWSYILGHKGRPHSVCRKRPQDFNRGHPLALHIGQYEDVLRTLFQHHEKIKNIFP